MKILVIGAGAIGCLVGGRLAHGGGEITLVGRPEVATQVQQHGLTLISPTEQLTITNLTVVDSVSAAYVQAFVPYDLAILCVKSYDTQATLNELTQAAERVNFELPTVLSLQTGLGNEDAVARVVGSARVIAGSIMTPVSVEAPGMIRIEKLRYEIGLGPWHPAVHQGVFEEIQSALRAAGFTVLVYANARGMKWTRLLMNITSNASSAILAMPPQEVLADSMLIDLEIEAWREAMAVMKAAHIVPVNMGSYPFALLAPLVRRLPNISLRAMLRRQIQGARGGKMPGLYLDLYKTPSRSEVDWLNGAIARQGKQIGVPTPVNQMLTDTLHHLVQYPAQRALWQGAGVRLFVTADEYRMSSGNV